jgi:hypothetical protein
MALNLGIHTDLDRDMLLVFFVLAWAGFLHIQNISTSILRKNI